MLQSDALPAQTLPEICETGSTQEHPQRVGMLKYCPHRLENSILEIAPQDLYAKGIRGVILDLDNTLVRWAREEVSPEIVAWTKKLREAGLDFCLLSNSVLRSRVDRVAKKLGCRNIHGAPKPKAHGFHLAMQTMGTTPSTTCIIGDQMFTDILGGNRVGIFTIMVKPIHKGEFLITRFVHRPSERFLLRYFRKKGHL